MPSQRQTFAEGCNRTSGSSRLLWFVCGVVLLALNGGAAAQTPGQKAKPGLWEFSSTIDDPEIQAAMAESAKMMADLPPEQRRMMEQMMAQQGLSVTAGTAGQTRVRMCLTPEEVARDDWMRDVTRKDGKPDPNCKDQITRRGNTVAFKFSCTGPDAHSGEGEFTFQGDTAYSGRMVMTGVSGPGKKTAFNSSGRWLGVDCGALKPARR